MTQFGARRKRVMSTYVISLDEAHVGQPPGGDHHGDPRHRHVRILRIADSLKECFAPVESFLGGLGLVILSSLLIIITNIIEVIVWASFFLVQGAQPNHSISMYNALLNYTTLQAGYLPQHWHLLEALLGMAGLLTVAWSTGILYMLAQDFQDTQLRKRRRKREERRSDPWIRQLRIH